jgi:membrane-associated phospholipid phosphatase
MTMLTTFVLLRFYYGSHLWEKAFWVGILVLEGIGRVQLNYHTFPQVIVGVAVGVIFYYPFEAVWRVCESSIPNLEEDYNSNELGLKMENSEFH